MLPERKHARLRGYDYSLPGAYFITICTADRRSHFGAIRSGEMQLSSLGKLVAEQWLSIPLHRGPRVVLDESVVMPNYFHGILVLLPGSRLVDAPSPPPVSQIVGNFKSAVTREKNARTGSPGASVFQPGFYDHVVRHDAALERVREYIRRNPKQWSVDRENPKRSGENEFYRWIEEYSRRISTEV